MNLSPTRLLPAIAGSSCLLLLAACGGGAGSEGSGDNTGGQMEPPPPPPQFVVRGDLFSFQTGMIANAEIDLWVQAAGVNFSYSRAYGPLQSDGLGLFEANVPESEISLVVESDDFVQPCAVRSKVSQDVEVRIEVLPVSALNVIHAPLPQLSFEPSVTGAIFETTATGRQAIAGAHLRAEDTRENGLATTRSDLDGGFYLCNLPEGTYIDVSMTGFKSRLVGPIDGTEPAVLEIVLEPEIPDPFDECEDWGCP
ncbi:MAG: carboxypeptidase-like regulatory domain-containing protein [Steroidobacteraceae bacterium]